MCSVAKLYGVILIAAITLVILVSCWKDLTETYPFLDNLSSKIKRTWNGMGSSSSTPIENAKAVNNETHQDAVEIRFDHMALGGTVTLILLLGLLFYFHYARLRRKLKEHRHRQQPPAEANPTPTTNPPLPQPPPAQYPQYPFHHMPIHPTPDHQWIQLEILRHLRNVNMFDSLTRFTELPQTPTRPQARRGLDAPSGVSPLPSPGSTRDRQ